MAVTIKHKMEKTKIDDDEMKKQLKKQLNILEKGLLFMSIGAFTWSNPPHNIVSGITFSIFLIIYISRRNI